MHFIRYSAIGHTASESFIFNETITSKKVEIKNFLLASYVETYAI